MHKPTNCASDDIDELEANAFAVEIITPTLIIRKLVLEKGITKIKDLSVIFNVSEQDIIHRLQSLGLVK